MNIKVLYVSSTGNTEKVAHQLFQALPAPCKDIERLENAMGKYDSDCYLLGFWANRGTANVEVLDFISGLHNKKVAFFGTYGLGDSSGGCAQLERKVLAFLPEDNEYFGSFFCQGKMPMQARSKLEQILLKENHKFAAQFLRSFDQALFHPSAEDLKNAIRFAHEIYHRMIMK